VHETWYMNREQCVQYARAKFGSLPWRSRSQHDLEAKLCPPHNLVIWSLILKLFHRNGHHIEMTCRKQYLGRYLEGQGHSMTLLQNRVWPITLLFEVGFYNFLTEMEPYWDDMSRATFWSLPWKSRSQHDLAATSFSAHNFVIWSWILQLFHRNDHHIGMTCRISHLGHYIEGQGHRMTFWSLPWRSRSQQDLAATSFSAHNFVILSWILQLFHRNDHHIGMTCRV